MILKFVILGEPIPKQSARFTKSGFAFQPKKIVTAKDNIRTQIINQLPSGFKMISEPLAILNLKFVFSPPQSLKKWQKEILNGDSLLIKTTKPDLDNLEKMLYDAMESVVYDNDSKIYQKSNVGKYYGLKPRIEIELETQSI